MSSSNRTTRRHVESMFDLFLTSIGGHRATDYKDIGGYGLDYAPIYGGYVIYRIGNEYGGQSHPFGDTRRKATEMWYTLRFAIDTLYLMESEQTKDI